MMGSAGLLSMSHAMGTIFEQRVPNVAGHAEFRLTCAFFSIALITICLSASPGCSTVLFGRDVDRGPEVCGIVLRMAPCRPSVRSSSLRRGGGVVEQFPY